MILKATKELYMVQFNGMEILIIYETTSWCIIKNSIGSIDILRTIKDPEKPGTLEDLNIVFEEGIDVLPNLEEDQCIVEIQFRFVFIGGINHGKGKS